VSGTRGRTLPPFVFLFPQLSHRLSPSEGLRFRLRSFRAMNSRCSFRNTKLFPHRLDALHQKVGFGLNAFSPAHLLRVKPACRNRDFAVRPLDRSNSGKPFIRLGPPRVCFPAPARWKRHRVSCFLQSGGVRSGLYRRVQATKPKAGDNQAHQDS